MELQKIRTGAKPNDGTGDSFLVGWEKANSNFERLSKVFNIKLEKVKETDSLEDIKPNMVIINENFAKLEDRLNS